MNGIYPESGKFAKNIGRDEYSVTLEGKVEYEVNGQKIFAKKGDAMLVRDKSIYKINRKGKVLALVKDSSGDKTEIV